MAINDVTTMENAEMKPRYRLMTILNSLTYGKKFEVSNIECNPKNLTLYRICGLTLD